MASSEVAFGPGLSYCRCCITVRLRLFLSSDCSFIIFPFIFSIASKRSLGARSSVEIYKLNEILRAGSLLLRKKLPVIDRDVKKQRT